MKKIIALAVLAGCGQVSDLHKDAQVVEISGQDFFVIPKPKNGPDVYMSGPNNPKVSAAFMAQNVTLPTSNVAAIEAVTGCRVKRETIVNFPSGPSLAAVSC